MTKRPSTRALATRARRARRRAITLTATACFVGAAIAGAYVYSETLGSNVRAEESIEGALADLHERITPLQEPQDAPVTHEKAAPALVLPTTAESPADPQEGAGEEAGEEGGAAPIAEPGSYGEVWAAMSVPRWGEQEIPVATGSSESDILDNGWAGAYEGMQAPGEPGNFGLSAHRTTHGGVFRNVHELEPGDEIYLTTQEGIYVYEVYDSEIVAPDDTAVLLPVPRDWETPASRADASRITLTTCHPLYSMEERYIVHGELVRFQPTE